MKKIVLAVSGDILPNGRLSSNGRRQVGELEKKFQRHNLTVFDAVIVSSDAASQETATILTGGWTSILPALHLDQHLDHSKIIMEVLICQSLHALLANVGAAIMNYVANVSAEILHKTHERETALVIPSGHSVSAVALATAMTNDSKAENVVLRPGSAIMAILRWPHHDNGDIAFIE